jgi:nucleoside-diphosphate-sugar epimerase
MMKKTVVVTGGAGFIGSNLVRALVKRGYNVRVVDNLSTGNIDNLHDVIPHIKFMGGDILDPAFLKKAFKDADYVLHQAALPSVPRSIADPETSHNVNVNGTFNVLLAAKEAGVKKVVLASSSSVYGNRKTRPTEGKKEILRSQPLSPYAVTKIIGEGYAKVFAHVYGLPTVCLRYFNVFGYRQDPSSEYSAVIPKFITKALKGDEVVIYGDGKQSRDFTHIDNVVEGNILAMESKSVSMGESINIACNDSISLLQLVKLIDKTLGTKTKIKFEDARPGEVRSSRANISKAKRLLGYEPKVKFEDGLKRAAEYYKTIV